MYRQCTTLLSALVRILNPEGKYFSKKGKYQSFEVKSYVLPLALPISENLKPLSAFFFQIAPPPIYPPSNEGPVIVITTADKRTP